MTDRKHALAKAWEAYADADKNYLFLRVEAACRAYYRAMIAATPGLCVHETDGTVRLPTSKDL